LAHLERSPVSPLLILHSLGQPVDRVQTTGLRESFRDNRERWEKMCGIRVYDQGPSERDRPCRRPINPFLPSLYHFSISEILLTQIQSLSIGPTSGSTGSRNTDTSHPRGCFLPQHESLDSLHLIIHSYLRLPAGDPDKSEAMCGRTPVRQLPHSPKPCDQHRLTALASRNMFSPSQKTMQNGVANVRRRVQLSSSVAIGLRVRQRLGLTER
jgi:hypothetical protein